ncbi:MAG: hypothetical protein V1779_08060 [bacterium]
MSDSKKHKYRFIWDRSFHDMIVITINVLENDFGELHFQKFCKEKPITEDSIVIDSHLKLFPANIYNLFNVIDKYDFWNTPSGNPYFMGLDASMWIIEGLRDGIYHYIERWWPLQHENVASGIGLKMLGLSRIKIDIIY